MNKQGIEAGARIICKGSEPRPCCETLCEGCLDEAERVIAAYKGVETLSTETAEDTQPVTDTDASPVETPVDMGSEKGLGKIYPGNTDDWDMDGDLERSKRNVGRFVELFHEAVNKQK